MSVQRFFVSRRISDAGADLPTRINAMGGVITEAGGYRIHTYTSVGTSFFQVLFAPPNSYGITSLLPVPPSRPRFY